MKEILFTTLIALMTTIILVHYEEFIDTDDSPSPPQTAPIVEEPPKDSVTQLKKIK